MSTPARATRRVGAFGSVLEAPQVLVVLLSGRIILYIYIYIHVYIYIYIYREIDR